MFGNSFHHCKCTCMYLCTWQTLTRLKKTIIIPDVLHHHTPLKMIQWQCSLQWKMLRCVTESLQFQSPRLKKRKQHQTTCGYSNELLALTAPIQQLQMLADTCVPQLHQCQHNTTQILYTLSEFQHPQSDESYRITRMMIWTVQMPARWRPLRRTILL